jgi:hypothetical protein
MSGQEIEWEKHYTAIGIPKHLRTITLAEMAAPEGYFRALRTCLDGSGGTLALCGSNLMDLGLVTLRVAARTKKADGNYQQVCRIGYHDLMSIARGEHPGSCEYTTLRLLRDLDLVAITYVPETDELEPRIAEWLSRHVSAGHTALLLTQAEITPFDGTGIQIWKFK